MRRIESLPRVKLAHLPTPVDELKNLSRELGGPRILMKRDDCTGLATGGNKTRKLEFLVGDALEKKAKTLITEGGAQSNHCRQTAAAAALHGLDCVLVLTRSKRRDVTGNLLLDQILGAKVAMVEDRKAGMEECAKEVEAPYLIPTGGSNGIGAMGYVVAFNEIMEQAKPDRIFFCSGSGGTHGGLEIGRKLAKSGVKLIGMSDGATKDELVPEVMRVCREGSDLLEAGLEFREDEIHFHDEYTPEGYGVPSEAMVEAVRLVARTEGILLDPVYSGKAMAGMIDRIRSGKVPKDETVVFIHTGGVPALFAYPEVFQEV